MIKFLAIPLANDINISHDTQYAASLIIYICV